MRIFKPYVQEQERDKQRSPGSKWLSSKSYYSIKCKLSPRVLADSWTVAAVTAVPYKRFLLRFPLWKNIDRYLREKSWATRNPRASRQGLACWSVDLQIKTLCDLVSWMLRRCHVGFPPWIIVMVHVDLNLDMNRPQIKTSQGLIWRLRFRVCDIMWGFFYCFGPNK